MCQIGHAQFPCPYEHREYQSSKTGTACLIWPLLGATEPMIDSFTASNSFSVVIEPFRHGLIWIQFDQHQFELIPRPRGKKTVVG